MQQLRIYTISESRREAFYDRWYRTAHPLMIAHGFRFTETWEGAPDPVQRTPTAQLGTLLNGARRLRHPIGGSRGIFEFGYRLDWDTAEELRRAWQNFLADPKWVAAKAASRSATGEPVLLVSDRIITTPRLASH